MGCNASCFSNESISFYPADRLVKKRITKYPPRMIRIVGKIYSASPSAEVPSSAPKIRRMTPGMNAHERVLPPGRTATRINVSPSPRKKNPPPISPLKSASNAETAPSVSNTPAGMIAHQRSVLVKYTHQNARLIPAKNTSPSIDESAGGRIDCAAKPSKVKAGKAAHQLLRSLNNIYRKRAPPAAKIKPQKMPPEFEITFIASSNASTPPNTKRMPSHNRGSNRFILFSFYFTDTVPRPASILISARSTAVSKLAD